MLDRIEKGLAQWYIENKENPKWVRPIDFAVSVNEVLSDIEKEIEQNGSDKVKKLWSLLKQQHISKMFDWALENKRVEMVLKIENDIIKTLTEDGAPLDVMFVSKGIDND